MNENFPKSCNFVIDELEGGDKLVTDSAGLTKYGISRRWHPDIDSATLSRGQAIKIYWDEYWATSGAALLLWPLDLVVFDAAVNQGLTVARSLRTVGGTWQDALLARLEAYVKIPGPLGDGWPNRLLKLWHFARSAA